MPTHYRDRSKVMVAGKLIPDPLHRPDRHAWWDCVITSMQAPFGAPCPGCCNHRTRGCGCRPTKAAQ